MILTCLPVLQKLASQSCWDLAEWGYIYQVWGICHRGHQKRCILWLIKIGMIPICPDWNVLKHAIHDCSWWQRRQNVLHASVQKVHRCCSEAGSTTSNAGYVIDGPLASCRKVKSIKSISSRAGDTRPGDPRRLILADLVLNEYSYSSSRWCAKDWSVLCEELSGFCHIASVLDVSPLNCSNWENMSRFRDHSCLETLVELFLQGNEWLAHARAIWEWGHSNLYNFQVAYPISSRQGWGWWYARAWHDFMS